MLDMIWPARILANIDAAENLLSLANGSDRQQCDNCIFRGWLGGLVGG